jgi:hypothetical protein
VKRGLVLALSLCATVFGFLGVFYAASAKALDLPRCETTLMANCVFYDNVARASGGLIFVSLTVLVLSLSAWAISEWRR